MKEVTAMKFKKLLSVAVLLLAVVLVALAASSCDASHTHAFSEWEAVQAPTCASFGLQKRACACGHTEYGTVEALPHNPVTDAAVAATCTAPGKTEGSHCADCGTVLIRQAETAKLTHGFSEWETVQAPTCTSFGLQKRACECGHTEYGTLAALSHAPVIDEAVAATCTTPGMTEGSHCGRCNAVITAQSTVAPTGHSCTNVTVLEEALCNLNGTKRHSCTNDGCSYYYDESYALPALDSGEIYANAVQYTGVIITFDHLGNLLKEGSAFVISADGKIVTSSLIVDNAFSALFALDGVYYDVTHVLAYSTESTIAVLKVDATDLPYANICTRTPADGEPVYLVGEPGGNTSSMAFGIISNTALMLDGTAYIQHDIPYNSGYVGSPLINKYGEVIGVNAGCIGDDRINVAARAADLEALDYSNPMPVAEYGSLTYTPAEQLNTWVSIYYNATNANSVAYVVAGDGFYYSLGYDTEAGYSFIEGYWVKDTVYQLYIRIILNNSNGVYQYYATLTDGARTNEMNGYLDAASFDKSTVLTYDTYYGRYWTEADLLSLYSTAAYDTLGWFSHCLDTYFDTLTLETFGFTAVTFERDEAALGKLNSFVAANGTQVGENGPFVLSVSNPMPNGDTAVLEIVYAPAGEGFAASTVVTLYYYTAGGELYVVSLSLDPTGEGNRFDVAYAVYDGTAFVPQCMGWGYLDAATFTNTTTLTCYVFDGMNEYEDAILADQASLLSFAMNWLNDLMATVGPELSIRDLGFLFFLG